MDPVRPKEFLRKLHLLPRATEKKVYFLFCSEGLREATLREMLFEYEYFQTCLYALFSIEKKYVNK